jgi:hypothetical protein
LEEPIKVFSTYHGVVTFGCGLVADPRTESHGLAAARPDSFGWILEWWLKRGVARIAMLEATRGNVGGDSDALIDQNQVSFVNVSLCKDAQRTHVLMF